MPTGATRSEEQQHDLDGFHDAPSNAPVFAPPYTQSYAPTTAAAGQAWPYEKYYYDPSTPDAGYYAPRYYAQSYDPVFTPTTARVFDPTSTPAELRAQLSKVFAQFAPKGYIPPKHKKKHMDLPAWQQTQQKLDVLSLEDSKNGPPGCRLSASPIWNRADFDWGITFYTSRDLTGSFRTYPDVGGPFQSLDEVNSAIDRYLIDHEDLTMCAGLSQVDAMIKRVRYYPDGTKKRGSIDKRRDADYQLARALVDMYNDQHNLLGDLAYEVKDCLHGKPLREGYIHWTYFHMNFTAKTEGSNGVGIGNLLFAEVTYKRGDGGLTVNSCCILEPSDHGFCYGCGPSGADIKHPNNGSAYAGGRRNISYRFENGGPALPPSYYQDRYNEDSDEEVERLRLQFKEYVDDPVPGEET